MRYQQCLMAAAFLSLLAPGCRKDKDSSPPSVRILSPSAGSLVGIPDTITVGVAVSDDRQLESLSIMVADVDGVPIAPAVTIELSTTSAEVAVDLPLIDERINSAEYQITAVVSDGANDARAFQPILINAAPLRVRSTFLIPPADGPGIQTITRIDSSGTPSAFMSVTEISHAVTGLDHLFLAGTMTRPLEKVRISTGAAQQIMYNPGLWPSYFTCLVRDPTDHRIYAGGADGAIKGFTNDGAPILTATLPSGFRAEAMGVSGNTLVVAAVNPVSQQHRVFRLGYASGAILDQFNGPGSVSSMAALDGTRVLLFGNAPSGGFIYELNLVGGASVSLRDFPGDSVRAAAAFEDSRFNLAMDSGIRRFDYQTTAVTTLIPGLVVEGLTWDPVAGHMLAAGGSSVTAFDPVSGAIVGTEAAPHAVADVLLQLNR